MHTMEGAAAFLTGEPFGSRLRQTERRKRKILSAAPTDLPVTALLIPSLFTSQSCLHDMFER